jgi:hypothetical protein
MARKGLIASKRNHSFVGLYQPRYENKNPKLDISFVPSWKSSLRFAECRLASVRFEPMNNDSLLVPWVHFVNRFVQHFPKVTQIISTRLSLTHWWKKRRVPEDNLEWKQHSKWVSWGIRSEKWRSWDSAARASCECAYCIAVCENENQKGFNAILMIQCLFVITANISGLANFNGIYWDVGYFLSFDISWKTTTSRVWAKLLTRTSQGIVHGWDCHSGWNKQ